MWVAIGTVAAVIGLSIALPFLGGAIGGEAAELGFFMGVLIGIPAFLLAIPVLLLAVVVDYAGRRTYPGIPIVASWDVCRDGKVHVVSLPQASSALPEAVWVDGTSIPLAWTPTGDWIGYAALDGGAFKGTLHLGFGARDVIANSVFAVLGGGASSAPTPRYTLEVNGATVEEVSVSDGQRRA